MKEITPQFVLKEYEKLETKKQKTEMAAAYCWMWDAVMELLAEKNSSKKGNRKGTNASN